MHLPIFVRGAREKISGYEKANNPHIVILSTAEFDAPVWTNKQHLAVRLAELTSVDYISSLGLRSPVLNRVDAIRVLRRLRKVFTKGNSKLPNDSHGRGLRVLSPLVVPYHSIRLVRWLNFLLMWPYRRSLASRAETVLWTFSPLTYGLENHVGRLVYHSVDLLHTVHRAPSRALLRAEERLLVRADDVIASSVGVKEHLTRAGRANVLLWENVAETDCFANAAARGTASRLERAIFAGNLTVSKVDVELLRDLADSGVEVVIAGPRGIDGSEKDDTLRHLLEHQRVTYLGNLSLQRLATECALSKVGLIPYCHNEYTAGVYPMKVNEYLASGLSVVSTTLPSLVGSSVSGSIAIVERAGFVAEVHRQLAGFDEVQARLRIEKSSGRSWLNRVGEAKNLLRLNGDL